MNHRVVVLLNKLNGPEVTRDEEVSLLWRFLNGSNDCVCHNQKEKPYAWTMEHGVDDSYTLTFSSVYIDIVKNFFEAAKKISGEAISVGNTLWTVSDALQIQDLNYIGKSVRVCTINGMIAMWNKCTKEGKKWHKTYDVSMEREAWINSVVKRLVRRANTFLKTDYDVSDISISHLHLDGYGYVEYKHAKIPIQDVQFKLSAPKEIIETALYSGIGSHTGSGFGRVVVL